MRVTQNIVHVKGICNMPKRKSGYISAPTPVHLGKDTAWNNGNVGILQHSAASQCVPNTHFGV